MIQLLKFLKYQIVSWMVGDTIQIFKPGKLIYRRESKASTKKETVKIASKKA